ncbi:MAG TPA: lysophospholipid acyltransferase family protein [Candidatus Limnocylindria bacterium]|nr:lysophospholipid acyltransferase family protein [Candidatus Limnocylindria bacterium]
MSTWFYMPGALLTEWLKWLLGGGRVDGLEHVPPEGPYIMVGNHCSNLDPPFIGAAIGRHTGRAIYFMAKDEISRWPLIGWLARSSGVFFVRRGEGDRGAQRIALQHLAAGRPIGIFPEGTRSRDGVLREPKLGVALLAIRSGAPLLPVGISGSGRIFPGRSRWPHRTRVDIRIGPLFRLPYQPEGRIDREALAAGTDRIMREIAALLPESQQGRYRPGPIESGGEHRAST